MPTPQDNNTMPTPCANGCPFFGTPQTDNLCSACYRLAQRARQITSPSVTSTAVPSATAADNSEVSSVSSMPHSPQVHQAQVQALQVQSLSQGGLNSSTVSSPLSALPDSSVGPVDTMMTPVPTPSTVSAVAQSSSITTNIPADSGIKKANPNRCAICRKKLGLTPFVCRCERSFCPVHRHSEAHACPFDYKAHHRQALARANPAVVAKKVDKI